MHAPRLWLRLVVAAAAVAVSGAVIVQLPATSLGRGQAARVDGGSRLTLYAGTQLQFRVTVGAQASEPVLVLGVYALGTALDSASMPNMAEWCAAPAAVRLVLASGTHAPTAVIHMADTYILVATHCGAVDYPITLGGSMEVSMLPDAAITVHDMPADMVITGGRVISLVAHAFLAVVFSVWVWMNRVHSSALHKAFILSQMCGVAAGVLHLLHLAVSPRRDVALVQGIAQAAANVLGSLEAACSGACNGLLLTAVLCAAERMPISIPQASRAPLHSNDVLLLVAPTAAWVVAEVLWFQERRMLVTVMSCAFITVLTFYSCKSFLRIPTVLPRGAAELLDEDTLQPLLNRSKNYLATLLVGMPAAELLLFGYFVGNGTGTDYDNWMFGPPTLFRLLALHAGALYVWRPGSGFGQRAVAASIVRAVQAFDAPPLNATEFMDPTRVLNGDTQQASAQGGAPCSECERELREAQHSHGMSRNSDATPHHAASHADDAWAAGGLVRPPAQI